MIKAGFPRFGFSPVGFKRTLIGLKEIVYVLFVPVGDDRFIASDGDIFKVWE